MCSLLLTRGKAAMDVNFFCGTRVKKVEKHCYNLPRIQFLLHHVDALIDEKNYFAKIQIIY